MGNIRNTKRLVNISNNREYVVLRGVYKEESETISRLISNIVKFEKHNLEIKQTLQVFEEVKVSIKGKENNRIIRVIKESLSFFRTFLNYWETYLTREFGKESEQFKTFKIETSKQFHNSFAYRFFIGLGNYIQHINFPSISIKSWINQNGLVEYSLIANSNELLRSFSWKSSVKNDLNRINGNFDILPLFKDVADSLIIIHNVTINKLDVLSVLRDCQELLLYKKEKINDCKLAMIEYKEGIKPNTLKGISVEEFPFELAEQIVSNTKLEK